jgi:hypothetical protein
LVTRHVSLAVVFAEGLVSAASASGLGPDFMAA